MEQAQRNDAMKGREEGSRSRRGTVAGCLLVATTLALFTGCATGGKVKVPAEPMSGAAQAPPALTGPSVVHLTDGREGFLIREPAVSDSALRGDFDRAGELIKAAKYDKAIELLEKVSAQAPKLTAPHINAAIAYRRIDKPEQAELHLKKALELIPGHPVASNEYGLLLRKAGRFAESRKVYEKSLAAFPEYYPVHKNLAILCDLYLKDAACAVQHYEIYGHAMPKDPQVKFWLAELQSRSSGNLTASAGTHKEAAHP